MNNVIATVGIRVDTKQLDELNRKLDEINRKTRDMGGEFSEVEKESSKTTKKMGDDWTKLGKKIGLGLGGAIATAITTAITAIVYNTTQYEKVVANLNSTLESTAHAAGFTADELTRLSKEISNNSTFSTNEIMDMQSNMLSYTNIVGDNYVQAVQLAIDYTARFGGSLQANSDAIGKALQNPIKGMGDLVQKGFELDASTRNLIISHLEFGRVAEAQAVVLEWVGEATQGAARAQRDTLAGAFQYATNAIRDQTAAVNEDGTAFTHLTNSLNDFGDSVNESEGNLVKFIATMIDAGAATPVAIFVSASDALSELLELFDGEGGRQGKLINELQRVNDEIKELARNTERSIEEEQRYQALIRERGQLTDRLDSSQGRLLRQLRSVGTQIELMERLNKRTIGQEQEYQRLLEYRLSLTNRLADAQRTLATEQQRALVSSAVDAAVNFSSPVPVDPSPELLDWAETFARATEEIGKNRIELLKLERDRKIAEAGIESDSRLRNANIEVIRREYDARIRAVQASDAQARAEQDARKSIEDSRRETERYIEAIKRLRNEQKEGISAIERDAQNTSVLMLHNIQLMEDAIRNNVRGNLTSAIIKENLDYFETSLDLLSRMGIQAELFVDNMNGLAIGGLDVGIDDYLRSNIPDFDNKPEVERKKLYEETLDVVNQILDREGGIAARVSASNADIRSRTAQLAYMEQYTVSTRINEQTIAGVKNGQLRTSEQITQFMRQQEFIERLRIQAARDGVVLDEEKLRIMRERYELSNKELADAQKQLAKTEQMAKDIGNILSNSILDGLNQGRMDFKSFLYDIGQYLLRSGINEIFASLFNPNSSNNTGLWQTIITSVIGAFTGGRFAGAGTVGAETVGTISTGANLANYAAKGAFSDGQGNWEFMSKGGILNRRTEFATNSGRAVAGEAAPEGVLPLARTPDGKLGVHSIGGGSREPASVGISQSNQFNITVQNSDNPARDDREAAMAIAEVARAVFNQEMDKAQRPGGRLTRQIQRYN